MAQKCIGRGRTSPHDTHKVSAGRRSAIAGDAQRLLGMGERQHHQRVRMRQTGSQQGIGPTGIAMEHRRAGGNAGLDLLRVRLQQQMRHAGVAKNLADCKGQTRPRRNDDMVSISRRLRGDLDFFSTGWLNDAASAAQKEPRQVTS